MKLFSKIRVLPVTIFAAALMVTVKVSDLFDGMSLEDNPVQLSQAVAQQNQEETPPEETEPAPENEESGEESAKGEEGSDGEEGEEKTADEEVNEDNPDNDPTLFTESEIDLLQQLADRREKLEQRTEEINLREGLLTAAEKRIDKKINELRRLESTIQGLIKTHDEQQEAKIGSLVKIYEAMKPKDAARIFEQLELDTLLLVAERMKERRLAPVLAQMNANKAKEVTVELSKLRDLPLPGSGGG